MKKLIVGNWKMNPNTGDEAKRLAREIKKISAKHGDKIVICPPTIFLREISGIVKKSRVALGAQDVFGEEKGSFTGGVSSMMLKNSGVSFVIVGHSERRALGETDSTIKKKLRVALKEGLTPILCVGEKERDTHGYYMATVKRQLEGAFFDIPGTLATKVIIAYEPVWAVGNKNFSGAHGDEALEMAIFIRKTLADFYGSRRGSSFAILYGGSVTAESAPDFLTRDGIDGLLVGRESLRASSFGEILNFRNKK